MKELLWQVFAWVVSRRPIADYLIRRAKRTPYYHLPAYMDRWWLFNGYSKDEPHTKKYPRLPSIRVHHILREDRGEHPHDHPWDARTIILKGWYTEYKLADWCKPDVLDYLYYVNSRSRGDTAPICFGEYHHITDVSPSGAWTLFFAWDYKGKWGFLVNGKKVPHDEYDGVR